MDRNIIISVRTIILTLLVLAAAYIVYRLGPVFAAIFVAGLIVLAVEPLVEWFKKIKVFNRQLSRGPAVIITYAIVIAVLILVVTLVLPPVISQGQRLINSLAGLIYETDFPIGDSISLSNILPQTSQLLGGVLQTLTSGFSVLTVAFTILVLSIYMSLDWENLKRRFVALFPDRNKLEILRTVEDVEKNVGQWVKGQLLLMTVIGTSATLGMLVIGIPYPLALGLISGVLEIVPILGPVISAVLAAIVAFSIDPVRGFIVLAFFVLIQQLENNILVPKIMQRVSGFSPLVILIALLTGTTFFGAAGALLAVPVMIIGVIITRSVLKHYGSNPFRQQAGDP